MGADAELEILFEEFPELSDKDVVLGKEVLAHFGLLFSGYANLEAGLQNCYLFWKLRLALSSGEISTDEDWENAHTQFEATAFSKTFGGLLTLLKDCAEIAPISQELVLLKECRNYFAHHFFREENDKMFSGASSMKLISRMNVLRRRVRECELIVERIGFEIFRQMYPNVDVNSKVAEFTQERMEELSANPPTQFGWESS